VGERGDDLVDSNATLLATNKDMLRELNASCPRVAPDVGKRLGRYRQENAARTCQFVKYGRRWFLAGEAAGTGTAPATVPRCVPVRTDVFRAVWRYGFLRKRSAAILHAERAASGCRRISFSTSP